MGLHVVTRISMDSFCSAYDYKALRVLAKHLVWRMGVGNCEYSPFSVL